MSALRRAAARALERGSLRGPVSRRLARVWEAIADPARPLALPSGATVIGVGGATLGGSGKTPVVIELARRLGPNSVAVVAHSYSARARAEPARRLSANVAAADVGDDAALLARALVPDGIAVVAGGDRSSALALAASLAPRVIVDGLLQSRPQRLALSILVLDAAEPWGSGACPPSGDLRAPVATLLRATDVVLALHGARPAAPLELESLRARSELGGALSAGGRQLGLSELRERRVGVVLAVARPDRILAELSAHGISPVRVELAADHAVPRPPGRASRVEGWLTTAKCATKLGPTYGGAPVWTLCHRVRVPDALVRLAGVAPRQKAVIESAPCFPTES